MEGGRKGGKERGREGEREDRREGKRKGDHIKVREFIITTLHVFMVFYIKT